MTVALPMYPAKTLAEHIESWSPKHRAVSCSNCLHAVVSGESSSPVVRCSAGHSDKVIHLDRILQSTRPTTFRSAATCPGFESMSDD